MDIGLRNKVTFHVHPANPQVDMQPTGSCEFWIRNVDLVRYKPKPTSEQPSTQILNLLFSQKFTHQEWLVSRKQMENVWA